MHPLCMPVVAACTRPTHLPCHQHYEADDKAALQRPAVPSQPQRVRACGVQQASHLRQLHKTMPLHLWHPRCKLQLLWSTLRSSDLFLAAEFMLEARAKPRAENGEAWPYHCLNLTPHCQVPRVLARREPGCQPPLSVQSH